MNPKGKKLVKEYVWDFAEDGGATGAIILKAASPGGDLLPEGFLVEQVTILTETLMASTGTPTVTFGPSASALGYLADVWAVASGANSVVRSGEVAGALLWDDTNDHEISYRVTSTANTQDVVMTVGTETLTAGKVKVVVEGIVPSAKLHINA